MVTFDQLSELVAQHRLEPVGQLIDSSNGALVCTVAGHKVVYKAQSLESPLWDFPEFTLSQREVAASTIDRMLGWNLVPPTVWTESGPVGPGSVQVYVDDAMVADVAIFEHNQVPDEWFHIVSGELEGKTVDVAHANDERLLQLALFDVLINNADRKGGHVIRDGHNNMWGIDHGVCFHEEAKLRTILWGWINQPVPAQYATDIRRTIEALPEIEGLSSEETQAILDRGARLLAKGLPEPSRRWPAIPWPVF